MQISDKMDIALIIKNVKKWVDKIQSEYDNLINVEIVTDDAKAYRAILHINSYMAQIVIGEQNFAPYNNIAFEIVGMKNNKMNMLYCWYDSEKDDINSIIEHLDIGLSNVLSN